MELLNAEEITELVENAQKGDEEAFENLMTAFSPFFYSLLSHFSFTRAEIENLFQEAWLRVWEHLPSFSPRGNFSRWFKTIVVHLALNAQRKKIHERKMVEQISREAHPAQELPDVYSPAEMLHALLNHLTPAEKLAITLFYLEGKNVTETAQILRKSEGATRVFLLRIRKKLRKIWKEKGYELP
ncbi:MAG: RNA polymerase sigma factor [bacterium]